MGFIEGVPNKGHSSAIPGMIGEIDPYTALKAKL